MNILFINCVFNMFDGIDSGAANRTTLFVKALSEIAHVDVISFYPQPVISNIPDCKVVFSGNVENPLNMNSNKVFRSLHKWTKLIFTPFDMYNYYRLDPKKESIVDSLYNTKKYEFVACRYINDLVECGLLKYSNKLIIDVDDNPVNALKRDMTNTQYRHCLHKLEIQIELKSLGTVVEQILKKVRLSFYSNIMEPPSPNSIYLHNTTTIKSRIPDIDESTPMRMLLVGWLDYFPNKNGAIHFVENIFPMIKKTIPNVELHIVGKCKDSNLISKFNQIKGVKALGYVDNIIEEYKNCRVVVVPVYQGAGTSVKFVEGLMMNRPMVSTPMGVRGFERLCIDGIHYMHGESDRDFANKAIELLNSIEKSIQISHNAFMVGDLNFSQDRFVKIVKDSVNNL